MVFYGTGFNEHYIASMKLVLPFKMGNWLLIGENDRVGEVTFGANEAIKREMGLGFVCIQR